jgi:O-antigen/teichoic acid export membrane protein
VRYLRDPDVRWAFIRMVVLLVPSSYGVMNTFTQSLQYLADQDGWSYWYIAACLLNIALVVMLVTQFRLEVRRAEKRRLTRRTPDHVG